MIKIIYNDNNFVVCEKQIGLSSQLSSGNNMVTELSNQLNCEIFPVHRLDTAVGGIMIYAKNQKSSAVFSQQICNNMFIKEYLAVVENHPETETGIFEDFLFKDSKKNKSFVVKKQRNGVKKAKLGYTVLSQTKSTSLVLIRLYTGRTHQIRVQFSSRKMPLLGDGKYGSKINTDITLYSYRLTFTDPVNGKIRTYYSLPDTGKKYWCDYKDIISSLNG